MASREEEKRLRREEREKAEKAAAASQSRGRRLQYLIGALVTIAVVVGVVLAVSGGGGDEDMPAAGDASVPESNAAIPPVSERNLEKAAAAAKCEVSSPSIEGSTHVNEKVSYQTNPPTSGNHNPTPALDGIYAAGNEPESENLVHALEHGRILVQYKPGTSPELVAQLETLVSEELNGKAGYKTLLFQNNTEMEPQVAATAWGQLITCDEPSDAMFDALRAFRVQNIDKGPENIPPTN